MGNHSYIIVVQCSLSTGTLVGCCKVNSLIIFAVLFFFFGGMGMK